MSGGTYMPLKNNGITCLKESNKQNWHFKCRDNNKRKTSYNTPTQTKNNGMNCLIKNRNGTVMP